MDPKFDVTEPKRDATSLVDKTNFTICKVGGTYDPGDHCTLAKIRVANADISEPIGDVQRYVSEHGMDATTNFATKTWSLDKSLEGFASATGLTTNFFMAVATFRGGNCGPIPPKTFTWRGTLGDCTQMIADSRQLGSQEAGCGCGKGMVVPPTVDVFPVEIQDGWLRYLLFRQNGTLGNRLMAPRPAMTGFGGKIIPAPIVPPKPAPAAQKASADPVDPTFPIPIDPLIPVDVAFLAQLCSRVQLVDLNLRESPRPLKAYQIAIAAARVQWWPDPKKPLFIEHPQGIMDCSGTDDFRPMKFPGLPKFSLVVHQPPVSRLYPMTSQCREAPQVIHLHPNQDVVVQLNTRIQNLLDSHGLIEIWVKVLV